MAEIAVNVAVIQDQKILLTQREDFETWILPGGGMKPGETIAVEWFPFDQLPSPLSIEHKRRIADAISGRESAVCVAQGIRMPDAPEKLDEQKLYELRDRSGLPRQEFYLKWMEKATFREEVELGDSK